MTITIRIDDIIEYRPDTGRKTPPLPRPVSRRIGIRYWQEGGTEDIRQGGSLQTSGMSAHEADTHTLELITKMLREMWPEVTGSVQT